MNISSEDSYKNFLKCKNDNEKFKENEAEVFVQYSKLNSPYNFSSKISFSNDNKIGKVKFLNKDDNICTREYNTSDYYFDYIQSPDKKSSILSIKIKNLPDFPNLVEIIFFSETFVEKYDLEETTELNFHKNVKDMNIDELFNEFKMNEKESMLIFDYFIVHFCSTELATKILKKNCNRNEEINKEIIKKLITKENPKWQLKINQHYL